MRLLNIKSIALVMGLTLVAMADVHAETCPTVSRDSDIEVSNSCDNGIALIGGNNLTIGTPMSGTVTVTNPDGNVVSVVGTGNTINNTANGDISSVDFNYGIYNRGTIDTLTNSGVIRAGMGGYGIINLNTIVELTNSDTIRAGAGGSGIYNNSAGVIGNLTNLGTIRAGVGGFGINNQRPFDGVRAEITTLTNSGTIEAEAEGIGIYNGGTITTLNNLESGTISAGAGGYGIYNDSAGVIGTLTNAGEISVESSRYGIFNAGTIDTLNNLESGTISAGAGGSGIYNDSAGVIGTLTNSSTISGAGRAGIENHGTIDTLTNSGTISAGDGGIGGIGILNFGTIDELTNSGTISAGNDGVGLWNYVDIGILTNTITGTISAGINSRGIINQATIDELTNLGTIRAGVGGYGISNYGIGGVRAEITTLTNSGTIEAGTRDPSSAEGGIGIYNGGTITTLNNLASGRILAGAGGSGIYNDSAGVIGTLTNLGTISAGDGGSGVYLNYGSAITSLNNSGIIYGNHIGVNSYVGTINSLVNSGSGEISGGNTAVLMDGGGYIGLLSNSNLISGGAYGISIAFYGVIDALINTSSISGSSSAGIYSFGAINNLLNSGTISGGFVGILNNVEGTISSNIETLTNLGSITGGSYGIYNIAPSTISFLNNLQGAGNTAGALTYYGKLPTNYNIIINGKAQYGQLSVTNGSGSMNFGIYSGSNISNGTYAGVLSSSDNTISLNNTNGKYGSANWLLNPVGDCSVSCIWDLIISGYYSGPSVANTNQSLVNTASALQGTYTLQNSVLANSFSYDCNVFGANNVCVSAGGRNTAVTAANGLNNTSALLIAAYRPHPNYRIGAYADQNLSVSNPGGTVNLGNNTPLIGLFGAWSQRLNGTGAEVKVSAAYGQKNTTIIRSVVGSGDGASEAGSGSSKLNSQGAQVTAKYGFAVMDKVIVSPYVGVRYTQNNMGGYTEATSSSVTAPLTYSALNTNATTALAGVGASYRVIPTVMTFASAGVETDTNTANGTYSATNSSIGTLTPVNFNANPVKTRPTATVGAYYDIEKNQRVGITGIYRQEPYQAVSTTTVMATYTIGL